MSETPLHRILRVIGPRAAELIVSPSLRNWEADQFRLSEAEEITGELAGSIVGLVGCRGLDAIIAIRSLAVMRPSTVIFKGSSFSEPELENDLRASGIGLVKISTTTSWEDVRVAAEKPMTTTQTAHTSMLGADLYSIAETTAKLVGGPVIINDANARMLAFSADTTQMDSMRRLSVLGRQPIPEHRRLLDKLGVFRQIRSSDAPVYLEENNALNLKPRIVVGIHSQGRFLGHIWAQEGHSPLSSDSAEVLRGAAHHIASELVRHANPLRIGEYKFQDFLLGADHVKEACFRTGLVSSAPAQLILFAWPEQAEAPDITQYAEVYNTVSIIFKRHRLMFSASRWGTAIGVVAGGLQTTRAQNGVRKAVEESILSIKRISDSRVYSVIGPVAPDMISLNSTLAATDAALRIARFRDSPDTLNVSDIEADLLLDSVGQFLDEAAKRGTTHRGLSRLALDHEELARTLSIYLDNFGDLARTAAMLGLHRNTIKYRVQNACDIAGIDLSNSGQRLAAELLLRPKELKG